MHLIVTILIPCKVEFSIPCKAKAFGRFFHRTRRFRFPFPGPQVIAFLSLLTLIPFIFHRSRQKYDC